MKTLAYCFDCNKEHDITNKGVQEYGMKCDCGGYVISPSEKVNMKLVPENNEDKNLLGIKIETISEEKPLPKVFKMDEYSWVCAMNEEDARSWYMNNTIEVAEDELDVKECDIKKGEMYSETSISDIINKIEEMDKYDEFNISVTRKYGSLFIKQTFKEVIEDMIKSSNYEDVVKEPFEICSTEW